MSAKQPNPHAENAKAQRNKPAHPTAHLNIITPEPASGGARCCCGGIDVWLSDPDAAGLLNVSWTAEGQRLVLVLGKSL